MGGFLSSKPSEEIQVSKQPVLATRKSSLAGMLRRKSNKDVNNNNNTPKQSETSREDNASTVVAYQPEVITEENDHHHHHRSDPPPPPLPPKQSNSREDNDQQQTNSVGMDHEPIVETVIQQREPTPPPAPDPIGDGGYLMFTPASDGTLTCHYSTERIQDALMYFKPKKIVPAFKYRQNAGRVEIIRKLQSNQQMYYEGVAQFIKMGREFDSDFVVLPQTKSMFQVWRLYDTNKIAFCSPGEFFPTTSFTSIACIPRDSQIFRGVQTMSKENFVSYANKVGKAFSF
jgi:hypothetical protein